MENNLVSLNRVFLSLNNPAAQRGLVFNQGDILRGLVQEIDANGIARVLIQGQLIEATAEAQVTSGQNLHLLVEEVQPGRITLKILTPDALSRIEQINLSSQLQELGMVPSESNIRLARSLLDDQLPVNRVTMGQAAQVLQSLGANTAENARAAALAVKYSLPANPPLLTRLATFLNSDQDITRIYEQLSRWLEQLPQVMETAVRYAGTESVGARNAAAGQPTGQLINNSTANSGTTPSFPAGGTAAQLPGRGIGQIGADATLVKGTTMEASNMNQSPVQISANSLSQNIGSNYQPVMAAATADPTPVSMTWSQSASPESIYKLLSAIQTLLENTMVRGDITAPQLKGQMQNLVRSGPDLIQGWLLAENILESAAPGQNHPLREMLGIIKSLEYEMSGQQIANTISRFSAETTFPGIYLAFPLKLEQHQYTMCELRLNRERRQMSRQNDSMQIAVSLDTSRMGLVLFHVAWKRSGSLDVQAVVEKDTVRQFFLNNWAELSRGLEQLGYQVNNLGIKVVDNRAEMESLRPSLQETSALNIRPISIDITI